METPSHDPALAAELQRLAALHVTTCKRTFGLDFEYSEASMELTDDAITKFHPEGASLESTVIAYGAYTGETIRRTLGGVWLQNEHGEAYLAGIGGADISVFPLSWAQKR